MYQSEDNFAKVPYLENLWQLNAAKDAAIAEFDAQWAKDWEVRWPPETRSDEVYRAVAAERMTHLYEGLRRDSLETYSKWREGAPSGMPAPERQESYLRYLECSEGEFPGDRKTKLLNKYRRRLRAYEQGVHLWCATEVAARGATAPDFIRYCDHFRHRERSLYRPEEHAFISPDFEFYCDPRDNGMRTRKLYLRIRLTAVKDPKYTGEILERRLLEMFENGGATDARLRRPHHDYAARLAKARAIGRMHWDLGCRNGFDLQDDAPGPVYALEAEHVHTRLGFSCVRWEWPRADGRPLRGKTLSWPDNPALIPTEGAPGLEALEKALAT